jgi:hypothetical protein
MTIKLNPFRLKKKKMINLSKIVIYLLFLPGIHVFGQEVIRPLDYNPALSGGEKIKESRLKSYKDVPLYLPFFDDFSNSPIWPSDSNWIDENVYINSTFSDNPITIGVATFDALDSVGKLYTQDNSQGSFLADKLTSRIIDLSSYNANDSITVSFFYEPSGLGEMPDRQDSFILQFHSAWLNKWITVWSVQGDTSTQFKRIMIRIDTMFLKKDFQFRFCNYVTTNLPNQTIGFNSNGDIWNLDYVQVDKKNKIETLCDMAIYRPLRSVLKNFESIPWNHYILPSVYQKEMPNYLYLYIKNNSDTVRDAIRTYVITDVRKNKSYTPFTPGSANFEPGQSLYYPDMLEYPLVSSDISDYALFTIKGFYVDTVERDPKINDTVTYTQVFRNYYSYDDGSAEFGYGLSGEGSLFGMVAYKFETYKEDSLQAINIFFNKSLNVSENDKEFYLTVWNDKNGLPGDTLYKKLNSSLDTYTPGNNNGFNEFQTYYLDTPIIVPEKFFVGWVQTHEVFLNVGLDRNRSPKNKIFYNLVGNYSSWNASSIDGALMIRPVLGSLAAAHTSVPEKVTQKISIVPNPASNWIQVILPEELNNRNIMVTIYDLAGNVLLNKTFDGQKINISGLRKGIYFIRIYSSQGNHFNCKFVKTCN